MSQSKVPPTSAAGASPVTSGRSLLHISLIALACLITALVALHIAAALKHLFQRDGVFVRMWPRRARRDVLAPAAHGTLRGA